jgi:CubicO group peptidase (beta-lactamase class C family)
MRNRSPRIATSNAIRSMSRAGNPAAAAWSRPVADLARYGQMLLNGGALDGKTYLTPQHVRGDDDRSYRPGLGRRAQLLLLPGDGFGFGYGFGVRTDPGNAVPPPPGSPGESNGTVRPAPISWSTAPRTCSLSCCKTRRPAACMFR